MMPLTWLALSACPKQAPVPAAPQPPALEALTPQAPKPQESVPQDTGEVYPAESEPADWVPQLLELEDMLQHAARKVQDDHDLEGLLALAEDELVELGWPEGCAQLAAVQLPADGLLSARCSDDYTDFDLSPDGWQKIAAQTSTATDDAFFVLWKAADYDPIADAGGTIRFSIECVPVGQGRIAAALEATLPVLQGPAGTRYVETARFVRGELVDSLVRGPDSWCPASDKERQAELIRVLRLPLFEAERTSLGEVLRQLSPGRSPPAGPPLEDALLDRPPAPRSSGYPAVHTFLEQYGLGECDPPEEEFSQSDPELPAECQAQVDQCAGGCSDGCNVCQEECARECLADCEDTGEGEEALLCRLACAQPIASCRESCRDSYPHCENDCWGEGYSCMTRVEAGEPAELEDTGQVYGD
jgi:hypothetical protein